MKRRVERLRPHGAGYRFLDVRVRGGSGTPISRSRPSPNKGRALCAIPGAYASTRTTGFSAARTQAVLAAGRGREPTLGELERETGIPQEKRLDKVKGSWGGDALSPSTGPWGDERRPASFIDFLPGTRGPFQPYDSLASQKWKR